jgi:hypothetical protein
MAKTARPRIERRLIGSFMMIGSLYTIVDPIQKRPEVTQDRVVG